MAYELRRLGRQKVRYDSLNGDNPLRFQLVVAGAKVTPASATITIYAHGGTTALVSAAAMTVSGSIVSYWVDTTTEASWPVGTGYRADIVVTYNALTWPRSIVFDVVKYLLDPGVGFDQLVGYDDGIRDMAHDGDEDFSNVIEACRDKLQLAIEAHVLGEGKLVENMILDSSKVAVAFRELVLSRIWFGKNQDKHEAYDGEYRGSLKLLLSSLQFDKNQDGAEDAQLGGIQPIRLVQ